uniref:Uncharacterized protein n=1 Tax=Rhizophora mucronata TaxID=61149 RepID=A0A2P2QVD6_RHIMU
MTNNSSHKMIMKLKLDDETNLFILLCHKSSKRISSLSIIFHLLPFS